MVVARGVRDGAGIFERCCYLRSYDESLLDMCTGEDLARLLIERVVDVELALWDMYRRFIEPAGKRVFDRVRRMVAGARICFPSCGAVRPLIEDFSELGVQILDPVQPLAAGMDSAGLKRGFGSRLCFHGGIDLQRAIDREPAEGHACRKRSRAAPDGRGARRSGQPCPRRGRRYGSGLNSSGSSDGACVRWMGPSLLWNSYASAR